MCKLLGVPPLVVYPIIYLRKLVTMLIMAVMHYPLLLELVFLMQYNYVTLAKVFAQIAIPVPLAHLHLA
jgi:hypothetical protein